MESNDHRVVTATIGGRERSFVLKAGSLYVAQRRHGYDVSHLEVDPEKVAIEGFAATVEWLWLASLAEEPDTGPEQFAMQFGFDEIEAMNELVGRVIEASGDAMKEAVDDAKGSKKKPDSPTSETSKNSISESSASPQAITTT